MKLSGVSEIVAAAMLALVSAACASAAPQDAANVSQASDASCIGIECRVFFTQSSAAAIDLCSGDDVSVLWKKGQERYLLTCADPATDEEDNHNFIVIGTTDSSGAKDVSLTALSYGHPISRAFLQSHLTERVPDKYAARPFCAPVDPDKVSQSDWILLHKQPSDDARGPDPYCFMASYVAYRQGRVSIETRQGKVADGDSAFFSHAALPYRQLRDIEALLQTAVGPSAAQGLLQRAQVIAVKASLFEAPDSGAGIAHQAYLVRGDVVTVQQSRGDWSRIRYTEANGKPIDRWLKTADIGRLPEAVNLARRTPSL